MNKEDDIDTDVKRKAKPTIEIVQKTKVRGGEFDAAAVIKKVRA